MGGGEASSGGCEVLCQMCEMEGHIGGNCPWVYTRCKQQGCNGIRKLLRSQKPNTEGKLFLVCDELNCGAFQWFDEASGTSARSLPAYSGCYACGNEKHNFESCVWKLTPCSDPCCGGLRKMKITKNNHNFGVPYLKCETCEKFEWFADVLVASKVHTYEDCIWKMLKKMKCTE